MKTQHESEMSELERNERQMREKYNETRTKLAECDATVQNFQATVKQYEMQLHHAQRVSTAGARRSFRSKTNFTFFLGHFDADVRQFGHRKGALQRECSTRSAT